MSFEIIVLVSIVIVVAVLAALYFFFRNKRNASLESEEFVPESFYADLEEPGFVFPGASAGTIAASASANPVARTGVTDTFDTKIELTHINVLKDNLADSREIFVQTINELFDRRMHEFVDYEQKISDLLVGQIKDFSENYIDYLMSDAAHKMEELHREFLVKLNSADNASIKRINEIQNEVANELELLSKSQNDVVKKSLKDISGLVATSKMKVRVLNTELDELNSLVENVKFTSVEKVRSTNELTDVEVKLQEVLRRVIPEHYRTKVDLGKKGKLADFAIVLPAESPDKKDVLMPIDTNFMSAVYEQIEQAKGSNDVQVLTALRVKLIEELIDYAKSVADEYLNPDVSTYYGILYIKQASLYTEILHEPQIFNDLKNKYHIILLGPATVEGFFTSFNLGIEELQVEKTSQGIKEELDGILDKISELNSAVKGTVDFHAKLDEVLTDQVKTMSDSAKAPLVSSQKVKSKAKRAPESTANTKDRIRKQISADSDE